MRRSAPAGWAIRPTATGLFGALRQQLHVVDVATGTVRRLTDGDGHAGAPAWSPDGRRLAFSAAGH